MSTPWIVRLGPRHDARVRIVCLPQAGGGTATFRPLAEHLPEEIELVAVRLPGRESRRREAVVRRMPELVDAVAVALKEQDDLPFGLFGYCSGGLVMLELARHLIASGGPSPIGLVAAAAPGPRTVERVRQVHAMPTPGLKDYLREYEVTPATILDDPLLFAIFEDAIRADYELWEGIPYRPRPKLDVPIGVIGARGDRGVAFEQLLEWREHTAAEFSLRLISGGHNLFGGDLHSLAGILAAEAERWTR